MVSHLLFISLGNGAYSEVYKVLRFSDEHEYALKKVEANNSNVDRLKWGIYLRKKKKMHSMKSES